MQYRNVRPDRVGYTGVVTSIPGYQPVPNAQRVAANFTMAPYWMNTINQFGAAGGKLSIRDRFRMWWLSVKLKNQQKQIAKVAALAPRALPPGQPQLPDPTAMPPVSENSINTANANKEAAGLAITTGSVMSGDDVMPNVLMPEMTAGTQISMQAAVGYPFDFANDIMNRVNNTYIGQRASETAYQQFILARTRGGY